MNLLRIVLAIIFVASILVMASESQYSIEGWRLAIIIVVLLFGVLFLLFCGDDNTPGCI